MPEEGDAYALEICFGIDALVDLCFYERKNLFFEEEGSCKCKGYQEQQGKCRDLQDLFQEAHRLVFFRVIESEVKVKTNAGISKCAN
jgi:hypothetical protein